jgi:Family of unknown function (DUF5681)
MLFRKGQSGNPSGRPRGSRNRATILFQNLLEEDAEAIARKTARPASAARREISDARSNGVGAAFRGQRCPSMTSCRFCFAEG